MRGKKNARLMGIMKNPDRNRGSLNAAIGEGDCLCRDRSERTKDRYFYPVLSTLRRILKRKSLPGFPALQKLGQHMLVKEMPRFLDDKMADDRRAENGKIP